MWTVPFYVIQYRYIILAIFIKILQTIDFAIMEIIHHRKQNYLLEPFINVKLSLWKIGHILTTAYRFKNGKLITRIFYLTLSTAHVLEIRTVSLRSCKAVKDSIQLKTIDRENLSHWISATKEWEIIIWCILQSTVLVWYTMLPPLQCICFVWPMYKTSVEIAVKELVKYSQISNLYCLKGNINAISAVLMEIQCPIR
jgi:hypothetical protein